MKKILIGLAALGAASGAAQAQSSVTLYGVADIAIGKVASGGDSRWGAQSNTIVTNGTSSIGLTGKEDLGGGLWAGFRFEGAVSLANGASGGSGMPSGGALWSNGAYVALGSNLFGAVKLGVNYTPEYEGVAAWELTQLANYSATGNTFGFGAYPASYNNAQIEYITPDMAGLSATIAYVPKAEGAVLNNGQNNQSDRWGLNVIYSQGPIKAALTAGKTRNAKEGAPAANKTNWSVGGSYTFGQNFALSASYHRAYSAQQWRQTKAVCANQNVYGCNGGAPAWGQRRFGWELGGSFFTGPFTVTLELTRDTRNDLYIQADGKGKKYTNGLLEGKYTLSKRTFVYADYLRLDGQNNYGIGVSHSF